MGGFLKFIDKFKTLIELAFIIGVAALAFYCQKVIVPYLNLVTTCEQYYYDRQYKAIRNYRLLNGSFNYSFDNMPPDLYNFT